MKVHNLINRNILCECGKTHFCRIRFLQIGSGALDTLPQALEEYHSIALIADQNTYPLCGEKVHSLLGDKLSGIHIYSGEGHLIPNEQAIAAARSILTDDTDFVLGIGSGVINDLCKYVSFFRGIRCGIIATATSMDGYASSGAAMILDGMKVTETTHSPDVIIGDIDILKTAPVEMVRSGYADIIGKYSALNDWKLSKLMNNEHFCPFLYDVVMDTTNEIRSLATSIAAMQDQAIIALMEALVLVGACLTLHTTTRPGSGSEHHMSHYFEITGLIDNVPYFLHGTDVGYATVVTAYLRQQITSLKTPKFTTVSRQTREKCYESIYKSFAGEVIKLQNTAGRYDQDLQELYRANWPQVLSILRECPSPDQILEMLTDVGMDPHAFHQMYSPEKIQRGIWFAKDLKDRYSVLWLYFQLFFTEEEGRRIYG